MVPDWLKKNDATAPKVSFLAGLHGKNDGFGFGGATRKSLDHYFLGGRHVLG
jgi:hypothetical protein